MRDLSVIVQLSALPKLGRGSAAELRRWHDNEEKVCVILLSPKSKLYIDSFNDFT